MQAARDGLTSLWNHAAILDRLEQEVSRGLRQDVSMGVLMADLDFFKDINDTHGHAIGDEVLRQVARVFTNAVRPYDGVGRYGGEEFLFVLPGCDKDSTISLADRLRLEISRLEVLRNLEVTMSVGATILNGRESVTAQALLRQADAALYQAKRGGRNRVEFLNTLPESATPGDVIASLACI